MLNSSCQGSLTTHDDAPVSVTSFTHTLAERAQLKRHLCDMCREYKFQFCPAKWCRCCWHKCWMCWCWCPATSENSPPVQAACTKVYQGLLWCFYPLKYVDFKLYRFEPAGAQTEQRSLEQYEGRGFDLGLSVVYVWKCPWAKYEKRKIVPKGASSAYENAMVGYYEEASEWTNEWMNEWMGKFRL